MLKFIIVCVPLMRLDTELTLQLCALNTETSGNLKGNRLLCLTHHVKLILDKLQQILPDSSDQRKDKKYIIPVFFTLSTHIDHAG